MILTKEQLVSLEAVAKPLMRWLNDNCHPHITAIVDSSRAEIVEGLAVILAKPHKETLNNTKNENH